MNTLPCYFGSSSATFFTTFWPFCPVGPSWTWIGLTGSFLGRFPGASIKCTVHTISSTSLESTTTGFSACRPRLPIGPGRTDLSITWGYIFIASLAATLARCSTNTFTNSRFYSQATCDSTFSPCLPIGPVATRLGIETFFCVFQLETTAFCWRMLTCSSSCLYTLAACCATIGPCSPYQIHILLTWHIHIARLELSTFSCTCIRLSCWTGTKTILITTCTWLGTVWPWSPCVPLWPAS